MKKRLILLVLACVLGGIGVQAQRPVDDTLSIGEGDYLYIPPYITGTYRFTLGQGNNIDAVYFEYYYILRQLLQTDQMTNEQFLQEYPDLATVCTGRHITGQQFSTSENMMVIGLAVCPTILINEYIGLSGWPGFGFNQLMLWVLDTTMANREDEYVQLYTIEGGQPQLQAEGVWRFEYPHRYMLFPRYRPHALHYAPNPYFDYLQTVCDDTIYVPLYEVMFDTGVYIDGKPFMLAGNIITMVRRGRWWQATRSLPSRQTAGSIILRPISTECIYSGPWWCRRDTNF